MKIAIRYYSKGGNTRKLANAIADELQTEALSVTSGLSHDTDILFLGSSVYAAGVDKEVRNFIEGLNVHVGQIVCFSTAAILKSTYEQIKKLANSKGLTVSDKEYHCKGSFGILHKGKPDSKNIREIKAFAKDIALNEVPYAR